MGAENAALGELETRLEAAFPTPRVDRGATMGRGVLVTSSLALLLLLSISRISAAVTPGIKGLFLSECHQVLRITPWFSDLSRPTRTLYRELVEAVALDRLCGQLILLVGELHSRLPGN